MHESGQTYMSTNQIWQLLKAETLGGSFVGPRLTIEDVYVKRAFAIDPPQVLRLPDRPLPY